jgi:hypothetical protein
MVLADAVDVEADLIGEDDLFQQVVQPLRRVGALARQRILRGFRKTVDAKFQGVRPFIFVLR